jgi:hypothetical protein
MAMQVFSAWAITNGLDEKRTEKPMRTRWQPGNLSTQNYDMHGVKLSRWILGTEPNLSLLVDTEVEFAKHSY